MILWVWVILSVCFIPLYVRIYKMALKNTSPIVRAAEEILKQHKEKP